MILLFVGKRKQLARPPSPCLIFSTKTTSFPSIHPANERNIFIFLIGTFVYFAPAAIFVTSTLLPHLILVLGATISLVSFLGYYGVMNEKRWILWVHGLILLIAIALQITVGAIAFVYRNQGTEVLDDAWDRVFRSDPRVILDLESFVSPLIIRGRLRSHVAIKRCGVLLKLY